jgi:hypothetical protein
MVGFKSSLTLSEIKQRSSLPFCQLALLLWFSFGLEVAPFTKPTCLEVPLKKKKLGIPIGDE